MTLRIVEETLEPGTLLRVLGDVAGSELRELEACCENAAPPLRVDLEGVVAFDEEGLVLLRAVAAHGALLVGASPYLSMRLHAKSLRRL